MKKTCRVAVEIPRELLDKALKASGTGITQTVRMGLHQVVASHACIRLREFGGKVSFSQTLVDLKADR
jgi:hypothetical protein